MRTDNIAFSSMRAAVLMLVFVLRAAVCLTQPQHQSNSSKDQFIREFLQNYVGTPHEETKTTRYSAAFVDLRDDGTKEVIVYLSSDGWCGTGGCTMLILAAEGTSYRVVTKTTITRLPIRVLATKSNGWHDIGVVARINGIEPLYDATLLFDGRTYPSNPSMPPARPLKGKVQGKIVIALAAKGETLYP